MEEVARVLLGEILYPAVDGGAEDGDRDVGTVASCD